MDQQRRGELSLFVIDEVEPISAADLEENERFLAALAASLISLAWVKIVGAVYLLWLPYTHFFRGEGGEGQSRIPPATPWLASFASQTPRKPW